MRDAVAMGQSFAHRIRIEAHAIWLAVRDPRTPAVAKVVGMLVVGYALSPIDLVPDFIPVLGLIDDALLIPAGVWLFAKLVPAELLAEHRATAQAASQRPVSRWGILVILATWAAIALIAYEFVMLRYD
ncbi:YkvA family protein [Sphingomonas turrisvirgatae]|nr:YkvA family protein [Sphingomonas turrisvirgatae]